MPRHRQTARKPESAATFLIGRLSTRSSDRMPMPRLAFKTQDPLTNIESPSYAAEGTVLD